MLVDFEKLPAESYLLRVLPNGSKFGDKYQVRLILACNDNECEVKGLDKKMTKQQRKEIDQPIREKAAGRKIFSMRHGRKVYY